MAQNTEMVLFYAPNPADPAILKAKGIFFRMKVRLRPVSPDQLHQTVGHLAGLKDCPAREAPDPCPVVDQPMLVLCGFSASRLDTLLKHLRQAQVRFPYKAVLTATNRDWPLCDRKRRYHGLAWRRTSDPPGRRAGALWITTSCSP